MSLSIVNYGTKVLREKGKAISEFDASLNQLCKDMISTMYEAEGIGLAAQQIGEALQFCVVDVPDHPEYPITCILDGKTLSPSPSHAYVFGKPKGQGTPQR